MPSSRTWVVLVGTRQSLSLRAWALVTPVGILAAPLATIAGIDSMTEFGHWLLLGCIAQIPLGLVMILGHAIARSASLGRSMVIVVTLLAGAIRGLTISLLVHSTEPATRVVSSAVTISIWLLVIGAALASHDRYKRELAGLLDALVARELHGRLLEASPDRQVDASTAQRIAETSAEVRAIVAESSGDHARTAVMLQAAIEQKLRPLSHDLWFSPAPIAPAGQHFRDVLLRIMHAPVPVAPLTACAAVLLAWGSVVLHHVWRGALVGLAIAAAYGITLVMAQCIRRSSPWAAVVRYLGTAVIPACVGYLSLAVLELGARLSPLAVALGLPAITMGVAASITLRADRTELIDELHARLAEPEWDRHLGDLVRRELDVGRATVLHNTVQPALTAAALQLQLSVALDEPERAQAALDRVSRALDEAEFFVPGENSGENRLGAVADTWSGIVDVRLHVPDLDLSSPEWNLLADVVDESIANAVRHGHASIIGIEISADPQTIRVRISDDSRAEEFSSGPGLGRSWLNSVVSATTLADSADGLTSRVLEIPRHS